MAMRGVAAAGEAPIPDRKVVSARTTYFSGCGRFAGRAKRSGRRPSAGERMGENGPPVQLEVPVGIAAE